NLFGNCQQGSIDTFRYVPNGGQLHDLELEIVHLVEDGYTWDDLYTQCVLGNILLAMRMDKPYDPSFCDSRDGTTNEGQGQRREILSEDFLRLLQKYIEGVRLDEDSDVIDVNDIGANDAVESPPVVKKETFINIHKYLKSHKRDKPPNDAWGNDGSSPPVEEESRNDDDELLSQLSASEVAMLTKYFQSLANRQLPDVDVPGDYESTRVVAPSTDSYGYSWEDQPISDENILKGVPFDETDEDSNLLTKLLIGNMKISDLSSDQVTRLVRYVNDMLSRFEDSGMTAPSGKTGQNQSSDQPEQSGKNKEQYSRKYSINICVYALNCGDTLVTFPEVAAPQNKDKRVVVNKEQLNDAVMSSPTGNSEVHVEMAPVTSASQKQTFLKDVIPKPDSRSDDHDTHFEDSMKPVPTEQAYDILNANFALNGVEDADNILLLLLNQMGLEIGSFSDIVVKGNEINFRVNPNAKGLNASTVAANTSKLNPPSITLSHLQ
ncbi:hypothetical protein NP493_220g03000, partial [Ridgeia piscesae]